ncbi:hypothetical protein M8J75_001191 [Diaphorina citri]|nr:hypothetical protein M8J75_001191 [Diaphorina citri]
MARCPSPLAWEVNRLAKDELIYELQLRGKEAKENETVESLRKRVRKHQATPPDHIRRTQDVGVARELLQHIRVGFDLVETLLEGCDGYMSQNWHIVTTKFQHYKLRMKQLELEGSALTELGVEHKDLLLRLTVLENRLASLYQEQRQQWTEEQSLPSNTSSTITSIPQGMPLDDQAGAVGYTPTAPSATDMFVTPSLTTPLCSVSITSQGVHFAKLPPAVTTERSADLTVPVPPARSYNKNSAIITQLRSPVPLSSFEPSAPHRPAPGVINPHLVSTSREEILEQEMRDRIQGPLESLDTYFQDKLRLINKVNRDIDETKKVRLIMMGLAPDVLAKVLLMENNTSLEGLETNIRKTDNIKYLVNAQSKKYRSISGSVSRESAAPDWAKDLINAVNSRQRDASPYKSDRQHDQDRKYDPTQGNELNLKKDIQDLKNELRQLRVDSSQVNRGRSAGNNSNVFQHSRSNHRYNNGRGGYARVCVDTGATKSCVAADLVRQVSNVQWVKTKSKPNLISAGGHSLHAIGTVEVSIMIQGVPFVVHLVVIEGLMTGVLLGMDFLNTYRARLDLGTGTLSLTSGDIDVRVPFRAKDSIDVPHERLEGVYDQQGFGQAAHREDRNIRNSFEVDSKEDPKLARKQVTFNPHISYQKFTPTDINSTQKSILTKEIVSRSMVVGDRVNCMCQLCKHNSTVAHRAGPPIVKDLHNNCLHSTGQGCSNNIDTLCQSKVMTVADLKAGVSSNLESATQDDNSTALTHLRNIKDPSSRLTRFALKLQEYDFEIKYKPGKLNSGPDFLSRNPLNSADTGADDEEIPVLNIQEVDLPTLQREDQDLSLLFKSIEHPVSVSSVDRRKARRYVIKNGVLYKKGPDSDNALLMVPKSLREKVIEDRHQNSVGGGHLGVRKCFEGLALKYYWPGMGSSVKDFIKRCQHCQYRKGPNSKVKPGLLKPIEIGADIFDRWGIDITGPFPVSDSKNLYIIAACEYLSGYLVTKAVRTTTSEDVCEFLYELVTQYGVPRHIISDNAPNLISKSVNQLLEQIGCKRINITGYHPQSNGVIESCFKSLKNMMALYVAPNHKDWDKFLPSLTFTLNASVKVSRGRSPFSILYGVEANLPVDVDLLSANNPDDLDSRVARLRVIREIAANHYNTGKIKQKELYDRNRTEVKYQVGDLVMLHSPRTYKGRSRKLQCHWTGPFEVKVVFNDNLNYVIKDVRGTKEHTVHVARLKKFYPPLVRN